MRTVVKPVMTRVLHATVHTVQTVSAATSLLQPPTEFLSMVNAYAQPATMMTLGRLSALLATTVARPATAHPTPTV